MVKIRIRKHRGIWHVTISNDTFTSTPYGRTTFPMVAYAPTWTEAANIARAMYKLRRSYQ